jgi:hypothetical protein
MQIFRNSGMHFRWQKLDLEIAAFPEFQSDDFVVVAQPLMLDVKIPLTSNGFIDMTYLSNDCFHISQKTNAWCKLLYVKTGRGSTGIDIDLMSEKIPSNLALTISSSCRCQCFVEQFIPTSWC